MDDFAYRAVTDPAEALAAAAGEGALYLAGGTELLNWLRLGIARADELIDIGALHAQRGIGCSGDELRIGALATLGEVGEHPLVAEHAAALAQACLQSASQQLRNRATLGGNALQRTRCPYFRCEAPLPWPCNKREAGSGCAALGGLHERHAIFGWTDACIAVHPSDPLVALACLDAQAELLAPGASRSLAVERLHLSPEEAREEGAADPGAQAQRESRLRRGELIAGYRLPIAAGERSAYVKVRERSSYEYALVSAAVALRIEDGRIARARIALGSVAQRPWRLPAAEREIVGLKPTREAVLPALREALAAARPLPQSAYKIGMAAHAAARAVALAGGAAQ
jgi:xanthine dehydrogenase YagS FAD-binding subunit